MKIKKIYMVGIFILPLILMIFSLFIGRYPITFNTILKVILNKTGYNYVVTDIQNSIILDIRIPRAILGFLVGGSLAIGGCALQGLFRNPLVDTGILGVNAGAGFGASLSIILFNNSYFTYLFAFIFGIIAVLLSYLISRFYNRSSTVMLILGGVVVSSIFVALLSFTKYIADPYDQLPTIIFWLMGSLAQASYEDIKIASIPIILGVTGLVLIRWRINILSMGDRDARAMGVDVNKTKIFIVVCSTMVTASAVCVSGTIGWIGLIIPHIGRMIVGNDNKYLIPISFSLGACFLLIIDSVARAYLGGELPLNILTALFGGPFYIYLLRKTKGGGW